MSFLKPMAGLALCLSFHALPITAKVLSEVVYVADSTAVAQEDADIDSITSYFDNINLGEVTVTHTLPKVKMKEQGVEVRVKGTWLANTGTLIDLLGKMPFVTRNGDGLEVVGKGEPTIYINGRKMRDKSELQSLSSSDIKNVEVITNPGASYDATTGSVILITTVPPRGEGVSVNDRTTVGYKHYLYLFQQAGMNYRRNGLDVFATFDYENYRDRVSTSMASTRRLPSGVFRQEAVDHGVSRYPVYHGKVGVNYAVGVHSLGGFYDFSFRPSYSTGQTASERWADGVQDDVMSSASRGEGRERQHLVSLYYSGKAGEWGIQANVDALWQINDRRNSEVENSASGGDRVFYAWNDVRNRMVAGNMSASHPLWRGDVRFGAEAVDIARRDIYSSDADFIDDNDTHIRETTVAVFAESSQSFGKVMLSAGLRWEYTDSRFYLSDVRQDDRSRRYSNLFPSASLSFPLGGVSFRANYSRKTSRPAFAQLSSTVRYIDRYSYESGNPSLKPIFRDYASLTLTWRDFLFEADYTSTENYFMWQTSAYPSHPEISLLRMENMPRFGAWSVTAMWSPVFGIWRPQLMGAIQWQDFSIIHNGSRMRLDKPMGIVRFDNAIHLPWDMWLNADLSWRSSGNGENLYVISTWTCNIGLYKSFADDTWSVKLQLNDLFDTGRQVVTSYDAISVVKVNKVYDTRDLSLTVRYNFNAARQRYRGEGAASRERSRL